MQRVYVAGPYTGDIIENVCTAIAAADLLLARGYCPYVPHLTMLWHLVSPKSYEDWLAFDLEWLAVCNCLVRLPGESKGADREATFAQEHGIEVYQGVEEFLEAMSEKARTV